MKSFKTTVLVALVALMAQNFAGFSAVSAAGETIKIASQSPLSGKQAALGTAIKNGAALAVKQLSKSITDLGFKVEFVPFDDQATPDVGVANAQNIVNDASILGVVGHLNSGAV